MRSLTFSRSLYFSLKSIPAESWNSHIEILFASTSSLLPKISHDVSVVVACWVLFEFWVVLKAWGRRKNGWERTQHLTVHRCNDCLDVGIGTQSTPTPLSFPPPQRNDPLGCKAIERNAYQQLISLSLQHMEWKYFSMSNSTLKLVDHTYRDFSTYLEDGGKLYKHKKCHKNFPAQLHKILSDPVHSEVVTWMVSACSIWNWFRNPTCNVPTLINLLQPHGRAFKVLNKDVFVSSVISKYTTCTKYESFTRQLNSWGFKRLYQSGPGL